ncbi:MAG: hypothetical protein U0165_17370 [Polyangiaceae bacterium]
MAEPTLLIALKIAGTKAGWRRPRWPISMETARRKSSFRAMIASSSAPRWVDRVVFRHRRAYLVERDRG